MLWLGRCRSIDDHFDFVCVSGPNAVEVLLKAREDAQLNEPHIDFNKSVNSPNLFENKAANSCVNMASLLVSILVFWIVLVSSFKQ